MPDLFSAEAIHASMQEAFAALPPKKRGAFIIDATVEDGTAQARLLAVQRIKGTWIVMAEARYDGAHVSGKVTVAGSW